MKVNDLLRESSESIITYLALVGHDITYYEQGSAAAKAQYKENPTEAYKLALKTILAEANRREAYKLALKTILAEANRREAYKLALKTILAEANRRIVSLLQNTELWKRLEADPEISMVYDRFVNLYNENDDFLESLR